MTTIDLAKDGPNFGITLRLGSIVGGQFFGNRLEEADFNNSSKH